LCRFLGNLRLSFQLAVKSQSSIGIFFHSSLKVKIATSIASSTQIDKSSKLSSTIIILKAGTKAEYQSSSFFIEK
jgi:hypothetical protein